MVAKIAWKNIWRNPQRSLIVITSIVLGLWAGTFIFAYVFGIMEQRLEDAIGYEVSHLQFHHPEYLKDNEPKYSIRKTGEIFKTLANHEMVQNTTGRVLAYGMVASPALSTGGKFIGVHPEEENAVTQLAKLVVEGEYLSNTDKNKIVVGKKLADKLEIKLRSKIVLTFQDADNNMVSGAFRVKGIFKSYNTSLEEANLYVCRSDLDRIMNNKGQVHEFAVLLKQSDQVDAFVAKMRELYPDLSVRGWAEISPELGLMINSLDQYMVIFLIIILLALSFGIINTMLMAVLERVREIGVLMAIGMNKLRVFIMIFLETFFIIGLAAPVGLLFAYLTINYLGTHGMDLTGIYDESYSAFGFKTIIYPQLAGVYYVRILIMVAITALLASLYPAYTAIRLDPVQAIKKI